MTEEKKGPTGKPARSAPGDGEPPDWYGWLGLAAMFLLGVARVTRDGGMWELPLLSLGEWLMLPLGAASLTMGLLSLGRIREKTLLPLWMAAVLPGVLWLAAAGLSMLRNGAGPDGGDLFLSWAVRLIFPGMAFLPLLASAKWRDRVMWALAAGLVLNVAVILAQFFSAGHAAADSENLAMGGLLADQGDWGMMLAVSLPLLAAWRGGNSGMNRATALLICMFLLPALTLSSCWSWAGLAGAGAGLVVCWVSWRSHAWIMGVFLCLLLFGYGSGERLARERDRRQLLAFSASEGGACNDVALKAFVNRPYTGLGPDAFQAKCSEVPEKGGRASWYAALLGGTGLIGLCLWLVMLAELAARALGRDGRRTLLRSGGVLGGTVGLAVASAWTGALSPGAGAMAGFLLAVSLLEEPEVAAAGRRASRSKDRSGLRALSQMDSITKIRARKRRAERARRADSPPADSGDSA